MRKTFKNIIVLCMCSLFLICLIACDNVDTTENVADLKYEPTFGITVDQLLASLDSAGYSVIDSMYTEEFEEYNEKHLGGEIKLNERDMLHITIKSSQNDVFRIDTTFVITNDTISAENVPNVHETILKALKPNIPDDFYKNLELYRSSDFENLRITLEKETPALENRIILKAIIVCIKGRQGDGSVV